MLFSRRGPLFGVKGRRSSAFSTQIDWDDREFQASFGSTLLRLAIALVVLAAPVRLGAAPETTGARRVRALVEAKIEHDGPGVAVLVSRNGAPIHLAGYGLADVKAETPITPDSLFDLASVSKHMTGVAILTLMEQGKLELDKPISDYLEEFKFPV